MARTGRPPGTKNQPGHKAGGSKKKKVKLAKGQLTITGVARGGGNSSIALQLPANESTTADTRESRQKMEEELVQEEVEHMNKAHALLKAVMEHPSNTNFGDAPFQADADADDNDGIAYDTDTEEDDAREEQVGVSSNPKKRCKRSYQPPRGSVLGEYLFKQPERESEKGYSCRIQQVQRSKMDTTTS
jgi:hypothetical protein